MVAWFRTRDTLRRIASVAEWGRWLRGSEPEVFCGESPVLHSGGRGLRSSEPEVLCGESRVLQSGVGGCVVQNQRCFAANRQCCRVR